MENDQETINMPKQKNESEQKTVQKKYADLPETKPETEDVSDDPPCPDYDDMYADISDEKKDDICLKLEKAKNVADEAYQDALAKAEIAKAQAEIKFDAAERSGRLADSKLGSKKEITKKQFNLDFKKCEDAIPKKCPSDEPAADKVAICETQLKQNLAKLDIQLEKETQKIEQEKSAAEYAWKKAQEDYDAELRIAEFVKDEAYLAAELECRKELSKELDKIQKGK